MSPTIFREGGYRFYFFSREELRMHVHVCSAQGEAKFWLEPVIALAQNAGLSPRQLRLCREWSRRTPMRSATRGSGISAPEVTNVSAHGFWLLLDGHELFLSFEQFPWFRDASIAQIARVERPSPSHLYWPALDVDLSVESIRDPAAFPRVSRV